MKTKKILISLTSLISSFSLPMILLACKEKIKEENSLLTTSSNIWSTKATFIFSNKDGSNFISKENELIYNFKYWKSDDESKIKYSRVKVVSRLSLDKDYNLKNNVQNIAVVNLDNLEPDKEYKFQFLKWEERKNRENNDKVSSGYFKEVKFETVKDYTYTFKTTSLPDISDVKISSGEDSSNQFNVKVLLNEKLLENQNQENNFILDYDEIINGKNVSKSIKTNTLNNNEVTFVLNNLNKNSQFRINKILLNNKILTWENYLFPKTIKTTGDVISLQQCFTCIPTENNTYNSIKNTNENSTSQNNSTLSKQEIILKVQLSKVIPNKNYKISLKKWSDPLSRFYEKGEEAFEILESNILTTENSTNTLIFRFLTNSENVNYESFFLDDFTMDGEKLVISEELFNKRDLRNEFNLKTIEGNRS